MNLITKSVFTLCLLLAALLNSTLVLAQGTFTGDLTLATQAEVNAFNYSEVTGELEISGADIVDLGPLSVLTTVGDWLNIHDNALLETIGAFSNLSYVDGTVLISDNVALTGVTGFGALESTGGGILFYDNHKLVTVDAFHALQSTGDNIDFWFHDSLTTVSGFGALHTAGWSLEFGGNPVLVEIPDFESLKTISSSLFIMINDLLPGITGFQNLEYVDWSFTVMENPMVDTLCGFYNYFSANNPYAGGGTLTIQDNHSDLPSPTTIQDIIDDGPCPMEPEMTSVPTLGQWGLWSLILLLLMGTWRHGSFCRFEVT